MGQANFKGFDDYIEIFRSGTHTDSKGITHTFTNDDLDQMVANTQPATAPAVIGHPSMDAPAWAWAESLKRDGDVLLAKFDQVDANFAQMVAEGKFKKRSISAGKNEHGQLYVKHIGWLGAAAPSVKGLKDVQFNESETDVVMEFTEVQAITEVGWLMNTIGNLFRGLREKIIADKGIEEADRFMPDWQINGLQTASETLQALIKSNPNNFAEGFDSTELESVMIAQLTEHMDKVSSPTQPSVVTFSEREQSLQTENQQLRQQLRQQVIDQQIKDWRAAGKILPAHEAGLSEFMASLADASASFEFTDGHATAQQQTPAEWFAQFVGQLTGVQLGQEVAGGDAPPPVPKDAESIRKAAAEFVHAQKEKGITVEWADAVIHVSSAGQV